MNTTSDVGTFGKKSLICMWAIIIIFMAIVITIGGVFVYRGISQRKAENQTRLEEAYKDQSFALGMNMESYYQDFDSVVMYSLIMNLGAYKEATQTDDPVTVEQVQKYLENEFDEKGRPAVLNPPENIRKMINWFWCEGGLKYSEHYELWVRHYLKDHPEEFNDVSINSFTADMLIELTEKFGECENKEDYMYY